MFFVLFLFFYFNFFHPTLTWLLGFSWSCYRSRGCQWQPPDLQIIGLCWSHIGKFSLWHTHITGNILLILWFCCFKFISVVPSVTEYRFIPKALAKRSNIVGQTPRIWLFNKFFDCLSHHKTLFIKHSLHTASRKCFKKHWYAKSACQTILCDVLKQSNIVGQTSEIFLSNKMF